jgi:hypothetical protein
MGNIKHGLKIVKGNKNSMASSATALHPEIPNTRIERYGFIADILVSRHSSGSIFHYVIQREGCADILVWGQELSMDAALKAVNEFLEAPTLRQA